MGLLDSFRSDKEPKEEIPKPAQASQSLLGNTLGQATASVSAAAGSIANAATSAANTTASTVSNAASQVATASQQAANTAVTSVTQLASSEPKLQRRVLPTDPNPNNPVSPTSPAGVVSDGSYQNSLVGSPTQIASPAAAPATSVAAPSTSTGKPPSPPPPAVGEVLKEAIKEDLGAIKGAASGVGNVMTRLKQRRPINLTLDRLVQIMFFLFLGNQLLFIKLLRPSPWWLMVFSAVGTVFGLGCSFLYFNNKKRKAETCDVLASDLGLKGLTHMLGTLPSWLSYTEREKVDWMNSILAEVWPYYDKGVCRMVKSITEDVFKQVLSSMPVPGLKRVGFKQLTFGDAPFRVESMYVSEKHSDQMVLEVDVRWCGDANITLAIELAAGDLTKICPRVTDISFVGSLRITLVPLVDQIPGFGAAVVTFRKPPRVKYALNFGKALGGKYVANVVKPFINMVINDWVLPAFIWPNRLVVPILNTPEMKLEVEKLQLRDRGLLKVLVVKAEGLPKADLIGGSDPLVELSTDGKHKVLTKCIKSTLDPVFNETFYLFVQEPGNQEMRVEVYDKDLVSLSSVKELLTGNVGEVFGNKESLCRCLVRLEPITSVAPEPVDKTYFLGEGEWSDPQGCGKGKGKIQLVCTYRPFESFTQSEVENTDLGAIVMRIVKCDKLPRTSADGLMKVYAKVKVGDESWTSPFCSSKTEEHRWGNCVHAFHNVKFKKDISIKLFESNLALDDEIGSFDIPIADVVESSKGVVADMNPLAGNQKEIGLFYRTVKLEPNADATMDVSIRWCPYF